MICKVVYIYKYVMEMYCVLYKCILSHINLEPVICMYSILYNALLVFHPSATPLSTSSLIHPPPRTSVRATFYVILRLFISYTSR